MISFYLPLCYTFNSRLNSFKEVFSWLFEFVFPLLLFAYLKYHIFDILLFILSLLYVYNIYEIGYIENDTETIKNENNPTMRLSGQELNYYNSHRSLIYLSRIVWIIVLAFFIYNSNDNYFIFYPLLLIPVFLTYNRIRNKWNIHLYLLQLFLRYSSILLLLTNMFDFNDLIYIFFMYQVMLYIYRSIIGRFGYINKFFKKYLIATKLEYPIFKLKYSFAILIISVVFLLCVNSCYVYTILSIYYFIYWSIRYYIKNSLKS